jgi:hypothetical protein
VLWGRIPQGNGGRVAAVLLVDNAAQPMQAAPVAALSGIAVSGNASKLHVTFTHFDQVKGDNLPGFSDRPVFNRMNLSLAVMEAAKTFHTRWRGIFGLDYNRDAPKLHRGGRHPRLGMAV